jgi:hypothetical protein
MKTLLTTALVLLAALAVVPAAEADAIPSPDCMPVYSRTDVGPIAVVRPNSCTVRVYECPYQGAPVSSCERIL